MNTQLKWIGIALGGLFFIALVASFFFFRSSPQTTTTQPNSGLRVANTVSTNVSSNNSSNGTQAIGGTSASQQKIFKIADGPVAGATFVQMTQPTTTLARYVMADNGHVFDLLLDSPGSVARAVSNTTIPGSVASWWGQNGTAVILQYIDGSIIKTLSLAFPQPATSSVQATRIHFFPDNIISIALSPDGKQAAYLLKNASGVDGYVSSIDASASKKLFSLALSQVLLLWPSPNTLLLQTKSAARVPGIVFSVDAKSGAIVPLLYATGITAIADRTFAHLVYRTDNAGVVSSYARDIKKGTELGLSFDPIPEKCVWSSIATNTLYCAAPLTAAPSNYLDLWHAGSASLADTLFSYNLTTGAVKILTVPGSTDGGVASDISEMALSADEHYLLFVTKGDRSVWGVRLTQ
jgi:hypothetical protein